MTEYKCVNGHDLCSTSYPGKECPYCEVKPMIKCKNADKYRGLRMPRCNGGRPCQTCWSKWYSRHHLSPTSANVINTYGQDEVQTHGE